MLLYFLALIAYNAWDTLLSSEITRDNLCLSFVEFYFIF